MKKRIYIYELFKTSERPQPFAPEYHQIQKIMENPKDGFEHMNAAIIFLQTYLEKESYLDKSRYTILEVYEKA